MQVLIDQQQASGLFQLTCDLFVSILDPDAFEVRHGIGEFAVGAYGAEQFQLIGRTKHRPLRRQHIEVSFTERGAMWNKPVPLSVVTIDAPTMRKYL